MALVIEWKTEAEDQLDQSLHYFLANFSERTASTFYAMVLERLDTLSRYPESGRQVGNEVLVRYALIKKSHYVYYTFSDSALTVIGLYGTRQEDNPYL
ncbi:type II toxin-antitoxin system RelE/ParE family toxin [Neolewinella sp.]|uniref:type II toxin-antitoxin system RelE/ParE family toxin n=1 Tax=Neolewinella sp. TaxID=2993543 RepID=UPI003B51F223